MRTAGASGRKGRPARIAVAAAVAAVWATTLSTDSAHAVIPPIECPDRALCWYEDTDYSGTEHADAPVPAVCLHIFRGARSVWNRSSERQRFWNSEDCMGSGITVEPGQYYSDLGYTSYSISASAF